MFNRYVVVPFVVWLVTQFLKFIIAAFKGRVDVRYLYASGGMPSVHAAVVCSLVVTSFLVDGIHSSIFGLSAIFAAIVMYDSFGVRRSSGEQAVAINAILDGINRGDITHPPARLREILGHKPLEVTVGAVLGVVLGCLFNYDKLGALTDFLTTPLELMHTYVFAAIALIVVLLGGALRWWLFRPYKTIVLARQAAVRSSWSAWSIGIVGLIVAGLQYEKVAIAQWLLWPGLLAILIVLALVLLTRHYYRTLPPVIAELKVETDKKKWFEGPNKKKRAKAARAKKR